MVLGEVGMVRKIDIDHEMQQAYLDYAMSVIVARALPDARDGLKPVHRRILYAMHDMGLQPSTSYKKSARIVGEVLGKYHPHGDMAVYDAMARMAQDFSMRYPLVDGQGNFGSVDGDSPAAMRYTEARLAALTTHILADIAKNTVDFSDNFDGTLREPDVLPAALPNMLLNGATGIAVGMATSIPPHNLGEIVDALTYLLQNWDAIDDITIEDLMHFVKGPDFPTGGVIIQDAEGDGLAGAYATGRGRITVQARAHLEQMDRGRSRIIVNELPYMTNKASLIERIAALTREGKLEGLTDLRDESDRHGMRIVIELNKNAEPESILRDLYRTTPMQSTFSINMLALVGGEPRTLGLKQALRVYLEHRQEIVRRRSEYDLDRARKRAHILEGLRVALKNLDEVIDLIRKSPDGDAARERLIKRFKLSVEQANAILELPLRRLAALERKKIEEEYKEVAALIKDLEALLRSPARIRQVISVELGDIRKQYDDRRRTHIVQLGHGETKTALLTTTDLAPSHIVWVLISEDGQVVRLPEDKSFKPGGSETPYWAFQANTRDTLYLVADTGQAAAVLVSNLPVGEKTAQGKEYAKLTALSADDILAAAFTLPQAVPTGDAFLLTVTRQGMVKKSPLSELPGLTAKPFTLVKVNEGDRLGWVSLTSGNDEIILATQKGMAIKFTEEDVRPMGLVAGGVLGIKLAPQDEVIGADVLSGSAAQVFLITSDAHAKRVPPDGFPRQGRYGQGVIAWGLTGRTRLVGLVVAAPKTRAAAHLMKATSRAFKLDDAPQQTRSARGARLFDLKAGDEVVGLTLALEIPGEPSASGGKKPRLPKSEGPDPKKTPPASTDGSGKPPAKAPPVNKVAGKSVGKATRKTAGMTAGMTAASASAARPAARKQSTATQPAVPSAKTAKPAAVAAKPAPSTTTAKKSVVPTPSSARVGKSSHPKKATPKPPTASETPKKPAAKKPPVVKQPPVSKTPAQPSLFDDEETKKPAASPKRKPAVK